MQELALQVVPLVRQQVLQVLPLEEQQALEACLIYRLLPVESEVPADLGTCSKEAAHSQLSEVEALVALEIC